MFTDLTLVYEYSARATKNTLKFVRSIFKMKQGSKFLLVGVLVLSSWVGFRIDQARAYVNPLENPVSSTTISGVCDPSMGFECRDEECKPGSWILPQGNGGQFKAGSRKFVSTHSKKYKCKPKPVAVGALDPEVPIEEIIIEPFAQCTESSTSCGQFIYFSDKGCTSLVKLTFDGYYHGCSF